MIRDLLFSSAGASSGWTPAELFKNGEKGFWLDGTDYSSMFKDYSGTIPVTGPSQPVMLWKSQPVCANPNDFITTNAAQALLTSISSNGNRVVINDGVDDVLTNQTGGWDDGFGATLMVGVKWVNSPNLLYCMYVTSSLTDIQIYKDTGATKLEIGVTPWGVTTSNDFLVNQPNVTGIAYRYAGELKGVLNGVISSTYMSYPDSTPTSIFLPPRQNVVYEHSQYVGINRQITDAEIQLLTDFIASKQ